jgi:hypothetical protein
MKFCILFYSSSPERIYSSVDDSRSLGKLFDNLLSSFWLVFFSIKEGT